MQFKEGMSPCGLRFGIQMSDLIFMDEFGNVPLTIFLFIFKLESYVDWYFHDKGGID